MQDRAQRVRLSRPLCLSPPGAGPPGVPGSRWRPGGKRAPSCVQTAGTGSVGVCGRARERGRVGGTQEGEGRAGVCDEGGRVGGLGRRRPPQILFALSLSLSRPRLKESLTATRASTTRGPREEDGPARGAACCLGGEAGWGACECVCVREEGRRRPRSATHARRQAHAHTHWRGEATGARDTPVNPQTRSGVTGIRTGALSQAMGWATRPLFRPASGALSCKRRAERGAAAAGRPSPPPPLATRTEKSWPRLPPRARPPRKGPRPP